MKRFYLYSSVLAVLSLTLVWSKKRPLSCQDFPQIIGWAQEEISTAREKVFQEDGKLKEQSQKLLEFLDPYKISFESKDVQQTHTYLTSIQNLNLSEQCEALKKWIERKRIYSQEQVQKLLAGLPTLKLHSNKNANVEDLLENYADQKEFTRNENERKLRWTRFSQEVLNSEKNLVTWFSGNQKQTLKTLMEGYFKSESHWEPTLLQSYIQSIDRFCNFFTEAHYQSFSNEMSGSFEGLGVQLRKTQWGAYVENVHPHTKLAKLLKKGSMILSLNGISLVNSDMDSVQKHIEKTSSFKLVVKDSPQAQERTFSYQKTILNSEKTEIQSKLLTQNEKKVLWVTIPSFYGKNESLHTQSSGEKVSELIQKAIKENNDFSLVLDLRNNPGGYLEEALEMGSLFLGKRPIVRVKREHTELVLKGKKDAIFNGPLFVLLDRESASSSEVLAGALLDHRRAIILGEKSFGKGSVQRFFPLEDSLKQSFFSRSVEGKLKITTHLFYSPLGHSPEKVGIQPDIKVKTTSTQSQILSQILEILDESENTSSIIAIK